MLHLILSSSLTQVGYEWDVSSFYSQASVASKVARKVSMGWWRGPVNVEFIKMRGPGGKGHAEMAITQQKGEERSSAEEMENDW